MRLNFLLALVFALSLSSYSYAQKALQIGTMCAGVTVTGAGTTAGPSGSGQKSFQAVVSGSGAVTATVLVQVSNDVSTQGWITLGTITLSGTTSSTDGFVSEGAWGYYRCNVTAITGTSAAVTLTYAAE